MSVAFIGDCKICGRTSHQLDINTVLCPNCQKNPESAQQQHDELKKQTRWTWFIIFAIIAGLCWLFHS